MDEHTAGSATSLAVTERQRVPKWHRARHTKSRNGCYPCKSRRVKCDELQPACRTCSSRGEICSYPEPRISSKKSPRSRRVEVGKDVQSLSLNAFVPSDGGPLLGLIQPLGIKASIQTTFSRQSTPGHGNLAMDDLKLLQFFHLHTSKQMSFHPRKTMVWQHIIPEIGSKYGYLMHLLLSLGGIHMITHHAGAKDSGGFGDSDMVDLATIMEHHQRGLEGFKEEVARVSPLNAEPVFTGSLLLVGFAFASLKVQELNPFIGSPEDIISGTGDLSSTNEVLSLGWLYLNRGISSILQHEQWNVLNASRLRQMLIYSHGDETWKDLPSNAHPSRLSRCSPRLLKFAEGATQAVADLKASLQSFESVRDHLSSCSGTPTSQPSPPMTLDWVGSAYIEATNILDTSYQRILSILRCAAVENPADMEIQMDFEDAALLSWPMLLPSAFLTLLERSESSSLHGHSLVILAHFYLVNTLFDTWFLRGSFEREILKINALVSTSNESQLSNLMLWPNAVVSMSLTRTPQTTSFPM